MSWILDGITLPVVDVQDEFSAAVAKHAFPYRNAQELEYLGVEERSIKISCLFYRARYDEHKALVRKLLSAKEQSHELLHPDFGLLKGSIDSIRNTYDERRNHVSMSISFIVEGDGDDDGGLFPVAASVQSTSRQAFADGQETLKESFGDAVAEAGGGDLVDAEVDPDQTLLAQFLSASTAVRSYLGQVDTAIDTCEQYLSTVSAPADSFLNTIEYGSTLPGRFVGVVNESLDRICAAEGDSTLSPRSWLENLRAAYISFAARFENRDFAAADQVNDAIAQRYALDVGAVYDADNVLSLSLAGIEDTPGFDVAGNRVVTEDAPVLLTINDLEQTLYSVRELLQAAVDRDRSREEPYKTLARILLDHVENVRLNRERIVEREITSEMPLHAICQRYNVPIGYADRILALNPWIKNPTFVKGTVKMYA